MEEEKRAVYLRASGKSTDGCAVLMNLWMCGGVTVWTHRANGISSVLHSADLETGISRMTHRPQVWEKKDRKRNIAIETDRQRKDKERVGSAIDF